MRRIKEEFDDEDRRKSGVIWHTKVSGKSLMMVMIAKSIQLDCEIRNMKIIIVTYKIDLVEKIKENFKN